MYDINFKKIKKKYYGGEMFALTICLIIFLVLSSSFIINISKKSKYDASTTATEIKYEISMNNDGDRMYSPTYYFRVNGKKYACGSNNSFNTMAADEDDLIYYDRDNPNNCITEYDLSFSKNSLFIIFFTLIIIIFCASKIFKGRKRIKKIKYLAKNGKLIKNLPYKNGPQYSISIEYTFLDGTTKQLISDPKYDYDNKNKLADLLIDPNDPNNYYIDFNIIRKD